MWTKWLYEREYSELQSLNQYVVSMLSLWMYVWCFFGGQNGTDSMKQASTKVQMLEHRP